jgi:hypothetical protein
VANKVLNQISRLCWVLLVLTLPITSQPAIAWFVRTGSVAPVAGIFLAVIFLIWFIPYVLRRGKIPGQTVPILFFCLWAVIVTLIAVFRANPPYKDIEVPASILKGLITLFIGVIFYLVTSTYIRSEKLIRVTMQLVNWSGLLIILWSLSQVAVNVIYGDYLHWMDVFQSFISTGVLVRGRASGFTLEPSWLAHQLNMLYLPLWLACAYFRYSAHTFRLGKIHFEDFLLLLGAITLMASFSRVGLLAFLLMLGFVFILINLRLIRWIEKWVFRSGQSPSRWKRILLRLGLILFLIIVYTGIVIIVTQVFIRFDPRMKTLFTFSQDKTDPVLRYANSLRFGERLVYWLAAWRIFGIFPWLGVGLGLAGYYIPGSIVPYGWSLVEVKALLFHSGNLLNIKSLWFRLLAETGIIGFSLFFSWLFVILITSIKLFIYHKQLFKVIGLTGIFVMIGFLVEGFSIDSFALPYLWFSTGLVTAASSLVANESSSTIKNEN